jgi:DNA-binding transcriptional ArsR family regulator
MISLRIYLQSYDCKITPINMETRRDVFQAIADPTRRQIIGLVVNKSQNLNSIAENFEVSRQAISVHIRILTECGLIVVKQQGRERYCEAKLDKLNEVSVWIEQYKQFWEHKFDHLELYLAKLQKNKKNAKSRK